MMEIYLLRHGIAEDAKPGQRDSDRALTPEGIRKLRQTLKRLKEARVAPALIVSSPFRRAVETADIAAEVLGYTSKVLLTKALQPEASPEGVWDELRVHRDAASVMLSGHEPLFSALSAYLLAAPSLVVDFKKGAVLRVDVTSLGAHPRGVLKWMLPNKLA